MKILKKIGIVLLVIIVILCIISLFMPFSTKVERSLLINAPHDVVHNQINTLKNWKNWSYWDSIDPKMKSTYSGPESGVGAKHSWESEHENVQHGTLTIITSTPDSIITELNFADMGPSIGGWVIRDTTGGVIVTSYMNMEMGFFFNLMSPMMDGMLGPDFERSLAGLKKTAESMPASPKAPDITVEETKTSDMIFASLKTECTKEQIGQRLGESYGRIGEFMKKNKLEFAGPVFAIYHSWANDKVSMEPGVPVNKTAKGEGDIKVTEWKAGNAIVAHYYGPYMGAVAAHERIDEYVKANNKKVIGAPWEVYVTDPMAEKDTMKWLTEVYYPVE